MEFETSTPELAQVLDDSLHRDDALHTWLHAHESEGAIPTARAALDEAFARGYAHGVEVMLEEHLDRLRTVLLRMLEHRFGELQGDAAVEVMDRLGQADQVHLERWCVTVLEAESLTGALPDHPTRD